ncbi:hypothetical protein HK100_010898 [Physocladia obscura]|uniref:Uncharacterized protein n=1 Tax=Physocladia obscura TaxID=109957 RepID=A0AAD5T2L8_9FUNG|nr:hypothetical protein HK100_010898 [Physocladia obscura]
MRRRPMTSEISTGSTFGCEFLKNNLLGNPKFARAAGQSLQGFIKYKAYSGPKYHGDTSDGLLNLYTALLDEYDYEGPIDEFANDDTREYIESMLIEIVTTSESLIRIPANWNPTLLIPTVPDEFYDFSDEDELDTWLDVHLCKVGADWQIVHGLWWHNEQAKSHPRPITISREQVKDVWRANGGSWCRYFGVKGRWVPGSRYLLSFDKLDVTRGYEVGNLIICLSRANDARYIYPHVNFLKWRDGVLTLPWRVEE